MTGKLFRFLSYSRRGAAAFIANDGPVRHPSSQVDLLVSRQVKDMPPPDGEVVTHHFKMQGPAETIGPDVMEVVRMSPVPGSDADAANYLAHIEFSHPDLPWMFTPQKAKEQLIPWINLVVIEQGPGAPRIKPGSPNPSITVPVSDLPDLTDSWAWAHVHVTAEAGVDIGPILANGHDPLAVSRLICPRRLDPHKDYLACVVPTYELGRQAGLTGIVADGPDDTPLTFAWIHGAPGQVKLPVFHHWHFRTGPAGDFETLAQRLFPISSEGTDAGQRTVLVGPRTSRFPSDAGFGASVIQARTAIATDTAPGPYSPISATAAPDRANLHNSLKKLINLRTGTDPRDGKTRHVVGPPIYGRWHAQIAQIAYDPEQAPAQPATWMEQLNLDPEMRAAAGLGARVVRLDQEALMADAWRQLKAVEEANRLARWSQVFMIASIKLHDKRLAVRPPAEVLRLANPSLGRLRDGEVTLARALALTTLPQSIIGASFARSARFAVKALERGGHRDLAVPAQVAARIVPTMLRGEPVFAQRFKAPEYLPPQEFKQLFVDPDLRQRVTGFVSGGSFDEVVDQIDTLPLIIETITNSITVGPEIEVRPGALDVTSFEYNSNHVIIQERDDAGFLTGAGLDRTNIQTRLTATHGQFEALAGLAQSPGFSAANNIRVLEARTGGVRALVVDRSAIPTLLEARPDIAVLAAAEEFVLSPVARQGFDTLAGVMTRDVEVRQQFGDFASVKSALYRKFNPAVDFTVSPVVGELGEAAKDIFVGMPPAAAVTRTEQRQAFPALQALEPEAVKAQVVSLLEPVRQYEKMLTWAVQIGNGGEIGSPRRRSPAHQIMFAPRFPQAMFERLKRLDTNWLLGHAEELPANSISIFLTNSSFIEAFLVGANYEMARELQWRRYPTDLMGTCFARFWSSHADDIAPIHLWDKPLGHNSPPSDGNRGDDTVVVIRGDLLRVYPNTQITAVLGKIQDDQLVTVETVPARFRQHLDPDITVAGFNIDRARLNAPPDAQSASWYIALTQPADEPRFGLDEMELDPGETAPRPTRRSDMSWQNMQEQIRDKHLLARTPIADQPADGWETAPGAKARWGADAGQIASLLYQRPFQILLKARDYIKDGA
jgi:hypothetical protein